MAYTNGWSDAIPLGSELAKHIDDQIRQLRLDIHERMDDLVVDWTADPVVFSPGGPGSSIILPASAFLTDAASSSAVSTGLNPVYARAKAATPQFYAPLSSYVRAGQEITKIEWLVSRGAPAVPTITVNLISMPFDLTVTLLTQTVEHTMSTSAGTLQLMDSGAISVTIDPNKYYILSFDQGNTGGNFAELYAARVTLG